MKNITKLFFAAAFLTVGMASAQSGVGVGTTNPDASAALDVTSTTKGFLMPRMTTAQRTAITAPAAGLQVYDTTTNSQWYYNGTAWVQGASKADGSKWTNDVANTRVALTNLSDGTTVRPAGTEFVVTDTGNVGIGTATPLNKFELINNSFTPGTNGNGGFAVYHTDATASIGTAIVNKYNSTGGSITNEKRSFYNGISLYGSGDYRKVSAVSNDVYFGLQYNTDGSATLVDKSGTVDFAYASTNFVGNLANSLILKNAYASTFDVNNTSTSGIIRNAFGVYVNNIKATGADASNPHRAYGIYLANNIIASGGSINQVYSIFSSTSAPSYFAGNVGIGTTTPTEKLEVNGAIKIGVTSAATPTAGTIRFNTTTSKFEGYDGTTWVAFH